MDQDTIAIVVSAIASGLALLGGGATLQSRKQLQAIVGAGEPLDGARLQSLEDRMARQEQRQDNQERRQDSLETETRDELRTMNASLSEMAVVLGRIDERTKAP